MIDGQDLFKISLDFPGLVSQVYNLNYLGGWGSGIKFKAELKDTLSNSVRAGVKIKR